MKVNNIVSGSSSDDLKILLGIKWLGLESLDGTITTDLGMNVDYIPDCTAIGSFLVLPDLPDCNFVGTIKQYVLNHLPKSDKCDRFHRCINAKNIAILPNASVGHNKICYIFKSGFKEDNISNWEEIHAPALCGLF